MERNLPERMAIPQLVRRLSSPSPPRVVEALGPSFYADAHLPGAINLPPDAVADRAAALLPDRAHEIVVYCSGECDRAQIVAARLEELGYRRVWVLDGGKGDWLAAGHPLDRSDGTP